MEAMPCKIAAVIALALFVAGVAVAQDAGVEPDAESGNAPDVVACARKAIQENFAKVTDYTCDLKSIRKAWDKDGELDKDNLVLKKVYARQPDRRKEEFLSGTIFGKPEPKRKFYFELLGLDQQDQPLGIEPFHPDHEKYYDFADGGTVEADGTKYRAVTFQTKDPDKTYLQHGRLLLPMDSCKPVRLEGRILQTKPVRNELDAVVMFGETVDGVWLPSEMRLTGRLKYLWMDVRSDTRNVFSGCKVNTGLTDEDFD